MDPMRRVGNLAFADLLILCLPFMAASFERESFDADVQKWYGWTLVIDMVLFRYRLSFR